VPRAGETMRQNDSPICGRIGKMQRAGQLLPLRVFKVNRSFHWVRLRLYSFYERFVVWEKPSSEKLNYHMLISIFR